MKRKIRKYEYHIELENGKQRVIYNEEGIERWTYKSIKDRWNSTSVVSGKIGVLIKWETMKGKQGNQRKELRKTTREH